MLCESVVRSPTQVNGEIGNSTPATPKPLNRSSPKVAYVIMSRISTHMQKLVTIPQRFFPRMREIAHRRCLCIHSFIIYSSFIMPTGSHIQIYSEVQLYNKLYVYTIGLHTDKHIMQEHIKGPYSEILQKHKNNTTQEDKPKNCFFFKLYSASFLFFVRVLPTAHSPGP